MDYLSQRGQVVEVLFGFLGARGEAARREATLALVPFPGLFVADVRLEPDDDGAVRCHLGGWAATLLRVSDELFLDVTRLAVIWPFLTSQLVRRTDEESARVLLRTAPTLERMGPDDHGRLTEMILEHQIRAENLHLLGEPPYVPVALEGELRFEVRFPRGTLELVYTEEAFRAAHSLDANPFVRPRLEVEAEFQGAPVELFRFIEWKEPEVAEVAVLASTMLAGSPEPVVQLLEAAFAEGIDETEDGALHATLLNLYGVGLRRVGRLEESVDRLTDALAIAESQDEELEQQVAYNLGYARLQTTMKARAGTDGAGLGTFTSHFLIEERHRATWRACLRDFERALELDPNDESAISQVALTRNLLALLDLEPEPRARSRPLPSATATPKGSRPAREGEDKEESLLWSWVVPIGVIAAMIVVIALGRRCDDSADRPRPAPRAVAPAGPPSPRELSEQVRVRMFQSPDRSVLSPTAGQAPCAFAVPLPRDVPQGVAMAPHLGRAIGTGELYGTEYFDATVRNYLRELAPYAEVLPMEAHGVGPLRGDAGPSESRWGREGYRLTLLVTEWRDPVILEGGSSMLPGEVAARLLVWSYEGSDFVCTGEVRAQNGSGLAIVRGDPLATSVLPSEDDPLNRARLDLIEQALRDGIPRLVATGGEAPAVE